MAPESSSCLILPGADVLKAPSALTLSTTLNLEQPGLGVTSQKKGTVLAEVLCILLQKGTQ